MLKNVDEFLLRIPFVGIWSLEVGRLAKRVCLTDLAEIDDQSNSVLGGPAHFKLNIKK